MNNLREIIQIFSYSFTHALQQYLRNLVQWVEKKPSYLFKLIYEFLISVLRLIKTRQFADTFSLSRVLESIKAVNLVPRVSPFFPAPLEREVRPWKPRWEAIFNMIATITTKKCLVIVKIISKPLANDRCHNDRLTTGFPSIWTIVPTKWETGGRMNHSIFFLANPSSAVVEFLWRSFLWFLCW